jgi:hypothetical protein
MKAESILALKTGCSIEEAVQLLIHATDGAQPVRWLEFPSAILICLAVSDDPASGAFYLLDRKQRVWLWIDFDDEAYGGYSVSDFDHLVHEYDFLSLVERPGLLRASSGWVLEPGKAAEMGFEA